MRRVLIGYHNDPVGNTAAQALASSLLAEGIEWAGCSSRRGRT